MPGAAVSCGSCVAREDERQRHGAVEQVGAAVLARALAGPETSSTSSRIWKASADVARKRIERIAVAGLDGAEATGGDEQARGLELAAMR